MRLNAYDLGALTGPTVTLTDADGVNRPMTIQSTSAHALDVQIPAGAALGGAHVTLTSGGTQYFGTLFLDSQDSIPALNGCVYEVSPSSLTVWTTLPLLVVTQAGCSYQVTASDGWVTRTSGVGTGVISVGFAPNLGGAARTTTIEIAGQPFTITQVVRPVPDPHIAIDTPTPNQTVTSAFEVGGWLLDAGAVNGTGVDDVKIYVQLPGGSAPGVFIGHGRLGLLRDDVGAIYGARFHRVGFHFTITGLSPEVGDTLWVIGHDTLTNADTISMSVPFTVDAKALMSIDLPSAESAIASNTFYVSGWAFDRAIEDNKSAPGTGVDTIVLYAFHNPGSGEPAILLGFADYGNISRPDVGDFYAVRYTKIGYVFTVDRAAAGLGTGEYNIVPIAHSTVTGTYNNLAIVRVILQ
jgi:hypothetical protein